MKKKNEEENVWATVFDNTGTKSALRCRTGTSIHFSVPCMTKPGCGIFELLLLIHGKYFSAMRSP